MHSNELYHHGVKGQRWGVRRYQNKDGSLTAAGKQRRAETTSFSSEVIAVRSRCTNKADPFRKQPIDRDAVKQRGDLNDEEANTCIRLANRLYDKASKEEPKITSDITKVAAESNASMYGLEYRLKQPTSLAAKIGSDAKGDKTSFDDAAKGIKDAVRYTVISDGSKFVKSYNSVKAKMESQGYTEVRCKNFFEKYRAGEVQHKAVQCSFETPSGYIFEVQFQTPESQAAKELKVPLYEERRQKGVNQERAAELEKQMHDLAERVPYPPNIASITSHNKPETKHSIGDDMDAYFAAVVDDYTLSHHGIKGMHWYQRRFQNEDGSLTAAGRVRYGVGQAAKAVATAPGRAVRAAGRTVKKKVRGKYVDFLTRDKEHFAKNKMKLSEDEMDWAQEKFRRQQVIDDLGAEDTRIASKYARNAADMADSAKRIGDVISSVAIGRSLSDLAQERTHNEPKDERYWRKEQAKIDYENRKLWYEQDKATLERQKQYAREKALDYGQELSSYADERYAETLRKEMEKYNSDPDDKRSDTEKARAADTVARETASKYFQDNFNEYCKNAGIDPNSVYNQGGKKGKKNKSARHSVDETAEYFATVLYGNDLEHHGVKGMHWYVRRYQPYPLGEDKGKVVGDAARKARERIAPAKALAKAQMDKTAAQIAKDLRKAQVAKMTRSLKSLKKNVNKLTDAEYEEAMKKFTRKQDISKMQQANFARAVDYTRMIENAVNSTRAVGDTISLVTTGEDLKTAAKKRRNPHDSDYYKLQSAKLDAAIKGLKLKQQEEDTAKATAAKIGQYIVNDQERERLKKLKIKNERAENEKDYKKKMDDLDYAKQAIKLGKDIADAKRKEAERVEKELNKQKAKDTSYFDMVADYNAFVSKNPGTKMTWEEYARKHGPGGKK